ncbi:MAG: fibronectin type III domain-containing protein, partial [bacterium]
NGQAYNFRVSAINTIGTGAASSTATSTPNPSVPSAPLSLSASSDLNTSSLLSWTIPLNDGGSTVTDYLVEYKLASEPTVWTVFNDGVSNGTTATVTGLTNGQAYNFRVSAINTIGTGAASSTATSTPNLSAPSAPLSLLALNYENTKSTLTWSTPASNGGGVISDYIIQYKLTSEPTTWTTFNDGVSTITTTIVIGLTNDLSYDFRVSAVNEGGAGSPSTTKSATPGNYTFFDEFNGTNINTNKWTESDTGGLGGSVGNVQQNNHLTIVGNNTWNVNGLESFPVFDRRKGNIEISTVMSNISCSLGSTMQFGYGDLNFFGATSGSYYINKNVNTWTLNYYLNGVNQSGTGTVIPGVNCTDNQNVTMKLVVLQSGGAEVYLDASNTPAASIAGGTFTNKPTWIQSRASVYITTFNNVTVKGSISGPDAPQDLIPTVNNEVVNLNWVAPYDNKSAITDYIIEYKLSSEPTIWTTFNDGVSTATSTAVTGLNTGQIYNFRVSAQNVNALGDLSSVVTAIPLSGTPTAPTASSVIISGSPSIGETVLGTYIYNDVNGNGETTSLYRWLRSGTLGGTYVAIVGATNTNYTITSNDSGKYLKFEVTPVTNISPTTGVTYLSSGVGPLTTVSYFNHVLLTGQSLAVGYGGTPLLSSAQPYNNKMPTGAEELGTTLVPLVEVNRETIRSALANNLTALSPNQDYQSAVTLHAVGNTAYVGLKKGTVPYSNGITQVTNVFNAVPGLGKVDRVVGVVTIHGEADLQAGTSASTYEADLVEWQNDYQTDAKAITGQIDNVPLFTDQMMSFTGYNHATSIIPGAQLSASENNPGKIFLVGPKYFFTYSDYAHLTNTSYRWLGGYYAKVMKKVLIDKESWRPLGPDTIVRSANIIYANFHVPAGQLAFDTTIVSPRSNYGFEYADSTSSANISSVEILDADTVKITLSNIPTGYSQKLRYAYTGTAGSSPGAQNVGSAAGNLRDTDSSVSLAGDSLYDWSVSFDKSISSANDATLPVVTGFSIPVNSGNLNIPINTFTATDNLSVMGYKITESSAAPSAGGSGWTSSAPTIYTFANEGAKTLYAWAKDAAGNISLSMSSSIDVDLTAPTITAFSLPTHSLSLLTNISSFTATDNFSVTGYLVKESPSTPVLDSVLWTGIAPTTFNFAGESSNILYAWTKDAVGNISLSSSAGVTINLTATAYTFTGPTSGSVNSSTTDFTVTPNNPYTGTVTITPSGAGSAGLSPNILTFSNSSTPQIFTLTPLASGSITLTPTNNGGITNPSNINFTVNAVAPNAPTGVTSSPGDVTASVSFSAPASDGGSSITGYTVTSIPSGGVDSNAGSTNTTHAITNLVNGISYKFTVRAANIIGQGAVSLESNSITPGDITPPTVTAFGLPATSGSLTINLTDFSAIDANGIAGYKLTETSTPPTSGSFGWTLTAPTNYTFSSSGTKTLYAWAKDPTGNVSSALSAQVIITVVSSNYSFTGPSSGEINIASTDFTISPVNPYTGTITIAPTGTGSTGLTTIIKTFSNSSTPQTFTITPTSLGLINLTPTNDGGLTNPSNIYYTVTEAPDITAPVISTIHTSPFSTSTYITWSTDDLTSGRIDYGLTNSYGNSTVEVDISPRATNHGVTISTLASCTTYHYSIYSKNSSNLSTQTGDQIFTTSGCTGGALVLNQSSSSITIVSGGSMELLTNNQGISLSVPVNFGSSDANFQIKKLDKNETITATSVPSGYLTIGSYVYDMKAISGDAATITTFINPLNVSMTYTTDDLVGKSESSLKIYRWDGVNWNALSNCSVNTTLKKVTCSTTNFSVFGLFGQVAVQIAVVSSGGGGGGGWFNIRYGCADVKATNYQLNVTHNKDLCTYPVIATPVIVPLVEKSVLKNTTDLFVPKDSIYKFTRDLKFGMKNTDVKELQKYLNSKGFVIAKNGAGSAGKENTSFGAATKNALIKFQKAKGIKPASGIFGPITRWVVNK